MNHSGVDVNMHEVHNLAGNSTIAFTSKALRVYVVHHSRAGIASGCGALGHLNPLEAEHALHGLAAGLEAHGLDAENFFGMPLERATNLVQSMQLPNDAGLRAKQLLNEHPEGSPAVFVTYGHEDGSVRVVGVKGIAHYRPGAGYVVSQCSDARVPTEASQAIAEEGIAALGRGASPLNLQFSLPHLVVPNADTQAPASMVIHTPSEHPPKRNGKSFHVTAVKDEPSLHELVSAAYAIASFGPHAKGSTDTLKTIRLQGLGSAAQAAWKAKLYGIKGVRVE